MKSDENLPYVPSTSVVPEFTIKALVLGGLLSLVMGAANTYLGLRVGMTVSASIPAAVISLALLRGLFRNATILENNIVQTMASTGESLAAGAIFTIPALLLVGAWQEFQFWPTTLIVLLGGLLGIVFMIPMRRALIINRPDLSYPEGIACSKVLIAGEQGGASAWMIGYGLLLGSVFKFLSTGINFIHGSVAAARVWRNSVWYAGADLSLALVAVGYIVNLHIASLVFFGGALGWFVLMPMLVPESMNGQTAIDMAMGIWSSQIRYVGVGIMLIGGLDSMWSVRRGLKEGLASLSPKHSKQPVDHARTQRDMSIWVMTPLFFATAIGTFFLYDFLVHSTFTAFAATVIMLFAAFIFVAVATYIAGLVGSSNSPVSGMTICALLMTAGVLLVLGVKGDSAILATLGVAGVVCCATCTAGDIAQDLKTGFLVGATPRYQQYAEVLGALFPAFFFAPIMTLLHRAYVIGSPNLVAPQAGLFAGLVRGLFSDGALPWDMVLWGILIGAGLVVLNGAFRFSGKQYRAHIMPVAVGVYLPFELSVPILIGGVIRYFLHRSRSTATGDHGVLFGSGLIAGESLMGITLAIPLALGLRLDQVIRSITGDFEPIRVISLTMFAVALAFFIRAAHNDAVSTSTE